MPTKNSLRLKIVLEIKDKDENREHEYGKAAVAAQLCRHLLQFISSAWAVVWKPMDSGKVTEYMHSRGHVCYKGSEKGLLVKLWTLFPSTVSKDSLASIFFCSWHLRFLFIFVCLFKGMLIPMGTSLIRKNDLLDLVLHAKSTCDYSI